jgi:hypothetical protein
VALVNCEGKNYKGSTMRSLAVDAMYTVDPGISKVLIMN